MIKHIFHAHFFEGNDLVPPSSHSWGKPPKPNLGRAQTNHLHSQCTFRFQVCYLVSSDGRFAREENDSIRFSVQFDSIRFDSVHPISSHFQRGSVDRIIANIGPSIRPSVNRHTRDPRLNGSRHRNAFSTSRQSDVPRIVRFRSNFVQSLSVVKPVYCICSRSKVKGQRSRSRGQSSRSQRNVTYLQEKRSKTATDRLSDFKLGTGDELKRIGTVGDRSTGV